MFQRILVPLDGSQLSEQALPKAAEMARLTGSVELILLRSRTFPTTLWTGADVMVPEQWAELQDFELPAIRDYLQEQAARTELAGLPVQQETGFGSPAEAILRCAEERQVDLIVMASHGRTGVGRWLLGSVAEKVLRHAPCPVLVVRAT